MGNWKPLDFLFASASSAAFFASGNARECLRACPPELPPPLPRLGALFSFLFCPAPKLPKSAKPDPAAPDDGAGGGPMLAIPMLGMAD